MTFKDQVAADIAATFLNTDEFAATHTIDGWPMSAVLTGSDGKEYPPNAEDGLWMVSITLSAATADLARLPKGLPQANRFLKVNGKSYRVISATDAVGMTRLMLELIQS